MKVDKVTVGFEFGKALQEVRNLLRQFIQIRLRENNINLTFEMLEVLFVLWRNDGINQQEIAVVTLKDKSSVTYLIDNLVKRNMVKRVEDEKDRRNKRIFLTPDGTKLKDRLHPWAAEAYEKAFIDVAGKDAKAVLVLLQRMADNLKSNQSTS